MLASIDFTKIIDEFAYFDLSQIIRSTLILGVAIDIIGSIPIILSLIDKKQNFETPKVAIYSCIMLFLFLFGGESLLGLFGVDISSFGIAGGIILFVMAAEMTFGITVFKEDGPSTNATIIPLVFPLFAGAAAFTALMSLLASGMHLVNLSIAIVINALFIFFVLKYVHLLERVLGKNGIYVLRKFFGVMLLAISVKFITSNLIDLIATIKHGVAQIVA